MELNLADLGFDPENIGVIVVDHGSRREESNNLLLEVVEAFHAHSSWKIVEPAHMELAEPSIKTAYGKCVERGAQLIVVFPYFLSPGRHWNQDIPTLTAKAAESHPSVKHLVTAPIGLHSLMFEIMNQRITHCLNQTSGKAPQCDICEDSQGCEVKEVSEGL